MMMEKQFPKTTDALADIARFVGKFAGENGLDSAATFTVNFIIEELFSNMVKYNPESQRDVAIAIKREKDKIIINHTQNFSSPYRTRQVP